MDKSTGLILFDGNCMLCSRFIQFALQHSKKDYLFISTHSKKGVELCKRLDINLVKKMDTIYLIDTHSIHIKSEAALNILSNCGNSLKLVCNILKIIPLTFRDLIYSFVSNNRYILPKKSCRIPTNIDRSNIFL